MNNWDKMKIAVFLIVVLIDKYYWVLLVMILMEIIVDAAMMNGKREFVSVRIGHLYFCYEE